MMIVRNILILLLLTGYQWGLAQKTNRTLDWSAKYSSEFGKLDSLSGVGKNRSAFELAESLFDRALQSQNIPGLVKSLDYMTVNSYRVQDEAMNMVLVKVGTARTSHPVVSSFLNSYLGELLSLYYERNRYRISRVVEQGISPNIDWTSLEKWTAAQFEQTIDSLYLQSIIPMELLDIPSEKTAEMLQGEVKAIHYELKPRVFDLLQSRYLEYLKNRRLNWTFQDFFPSEEEIRQLTKLDLTEFMETHADESGFHKVIKAYHQWEKSFSDTEFNEAYVSVILERNDFVRSRLDNDDQESQLGLLNALLDLYPSVKNLLAVYNSIAGVYYNQEKYPEALQIINKGLKRTPSNTYGRLIDEANQLIYSIKSPELNLSVEETYPTNRNPLVSIQFRNMDKMKLELYPLTESEFIDWSFSSRNNEEQSRKMAPKNTIWAKIIDLPVSADYRSHRTETLINRKLGRGAYVLKYWYKRDSVELSGFALFQVTDLALMSKSDQDSNELYVFNRRTGMLVKDAKVEAITIIRYPEFRNSEIRILREKGDGRYILPQKPLNLYYKVTSDSDRYISPLTYNGVTHHSQQQPVRRTVLFTDRAIYQPGNTIHFKALTVLSVNLKSEVLEGQEVSISLRDANGQEIWQKNYRTDEWGSVSGSIPIPVEGLPGSWSLQSAPSGQVRVQVEEYQRPQYEIKVEEKDISRNDSIVHVKGIVQTYHGFPIQDGKVKARVELEKRHWFYYRMPEITKVVYHSEFSTDEIGQFEFDFEAVEVPEKDQLYGSFYFYSIHLTVQSSSGEIRELTKTIPLDPNKVQVQILHQPIYLTTQKLTPQLRVMNAMNEPASQSVHLEISRLKSPREYKVERYWPLPDQPLLTPSEFRKRVPHLFYNHEASLNHWEKERTLKTWSQVISDRDSIGLDADISESGYYRIEIFSDQGDTLASSSFGIVEKDEYHSLLHDALELIPDKLSAEPGDSVELLILSAPGMQGGGLIISHPDGERAEYDLSDTRVIHIPVAEIDRGGIHISGFGYFADRTFEKSLFIEVPWSNKKLSISQEDPIERVEVNTDTNLIIRILDNMGEGDLTEVAIAIYDASLDAYIPHDWGTGFQLFHLFQNAVYVRNLGGRLAQIVYYKNTYWQRNEVIRSLWIPELPALNVGYGGILYARNRTTMMESVAPSSEDVLLKSYDNLANDNGAVPIQERGEESPMKESHRVRIDFSEILLFSGKLTTDSSGELNIPFHTNDKAGRWNVLVFSHRKDLSFGYQKFSFETFKDLYLESFLPGMVRQGDSLLLNSTLYNTTDHIISGQVHFEITPLFSGDSVQSYTQNLSFELSGGRSVVLSLPVSIGKEEGGPLLVSARVVDVEGKVWDATEETIPVLPAKEKIYDGKVLVLKEGQEWSGNTIQENISSGTNEIGIRIIQNMYTELMKSIPYLQHSNPVTTDQYFSNGVQAIMGEYLTGQIPRFKEIYEEWKRKGELESRLSQNSDKKYISLNNTSWVRESNTGTEKMALLGLYFDQAHIQQVIQTNISTWLKSQNLDGGFPWIDRGPSNFYITVRFLKELGKMEWAGLRMPSFTDEKKNAAISYLDKEFLSEWNRLKKKSSKGGIAYDRFIPYFIQRAYYTRESEGPEEFQMAWIELKDSIFNNWSKRESDLRAGIGIAAWYLGDKDLSRMIADAFEDNAIRDPKLGVYWRYNHQSVQSGYLNVLSSITELLLLNERENLNDGIFQWVLVNAMTNDWQGNPAVTSLILSLLKMNKDFTEPSATYIYRNGKREKLAGMGDVADFRISVDELQSFRIDHPKGPPLWLGIIWSGEVNPEDDIEQSGDILHIKKTVYGVDSSHILSMGDQITIRLAITTDRDLDYVYIEDPLLPGLDPGISLSGYNWRYGLSYYQAFSLASSRFFIDHLPKGEHLLEYKVGVVREGVFRHPRTKIQSYFVPEISGFDQWAPVVRIKSKGDKG